MSDRGHDDLADELEELDAVEVLAALAEADAATPPQALRASLLETVADRPRREAESLPASRLYARRAAAVRALLTEIGGDEWIAVAAPYPWTVLRLVAHLAVIEEYTARQLGLTRAAPLPLAHAEAADHLKMGAAAVEAMVAAGPSATIARWDAAAALVTGHVTSDRYDPRASAALHGWPFDADTALVARAFELWTHADDIRRATGRALDVPDAAELRTMSSVSVGGLPALLALAGTTIAPTRIVLTGPGGGTFDIVAPGAAGGERNLLVTSVVDYCRVVARRIDPDDLHATRSGDDRQLASLLHAASAIAV